MARQSNRVTSTRQALKLPPGVKPARTPMSPEMLADVVTDRGIAHGGLYSARQAAAARLANEDHHPANEVTIASAAQA